MTGADYFAQGLHFCEKALEPYREQAGASFHAMSLHNSLASFVVQKAAVLINEGQFDVASDLIIIASQALQALASEGLKDPEVMMYAKAAVERAVGLTELPEDPRASPSTNALTPEELCALGLNSGNV